MKLRLQCAFDLRRCRSAFFVERSSRRDVHQLERQKADEQHQWDREGKSLKEIQHCYCPVVRRAVALGRASNASALAVSMQSRRTLTLTLLERERGTFGGTVSGSPNSAPRRARSSSPLPARSGERIKVRGASDCILTLSPSQEGN